jgi:hypothetical protein
VPACASQGRCPQWVLAKLQGVPENEQRQMKTFVRFTFYEISAAQIYYLISRFWFILKSRWKLSFFGGNNFRWKLACFHFSVKQTFLGGNYFVGGSS